MDHCRRHGRPTHHHAIHYQPPTPRICLDQIQPTHLERAHRLTTLNPSGRIVTSLGPLIADCAFLTCRNGHV